MAEQLEDISLRELLNDFWRGRWLILGVSVAAAAAAGVTRLLIEEQYEAETVVAMSTEDSGGILGGLGDSLFGRYGGLASLAGVSLPAAQKEEVVAVLTSELLTSAFIEEEKLLPELYSEQWDSAQGTWKPGGKPPTVWSANRYFDDEIRRVEDDGRGLIVLKVRWKDPVLAARWANALVERTNEYLRAKAIREAERNMEYLNEQLTKTNIVEVRRAINTLLEQEINRAMLARGRDEYALKVIDPAVPPEEPSTPSLAVMVIVGFVAGGFLAILIVIGRRALAI